jgi:predicted acetylornithine/succinylornithine family transaminase
MKTALLEVYKRAEPLFVSGEGCRLVDEDGREYIDFVAGIAVNALGYGDAGIAAAIREALNSGLIHTSNLFRTSAGERLAEELVAHSFADRVFFCNSGGEANEGAIKIARRHARLQGGPEKHEVVAFRGSFHGRLMGTLAITDRPSYRDPFLPVMPGAHIVDVSDDDAIRAVVSAQRTAAIFIEPIQGEGGVRPIAPERLAFLRALADDADALLVFDEVQCGLGRSGRLFAHEATGVTPDIMCIAKPLGGGLPMGAILMTDRVAAAMRPGEHATTFGGGPLVSAVALEVLRRVTAPGFLADVRSRGEQVAETVRAWQHPHIVESRGAGLIRGIELDVDAAPVVKAAFDAGLLLVTAGERVIRIVPPLVIGADELASGLEILRSALDAVTGTAVDAPRVAAARA